MGREERRGAKRGEERRGAKRGDEMGRTRRRMVGEYKTVGEGVPPDRTTTHASCSHEVSSAADRAP
eukprot:765101-Hanusia_phi.AAC.1